MSDVAAPAEGFVYELARVENPSPGNVEMIMLRALTTEEYDEAGNALGVVQSVLRGFDNFLTRAHDELSTTIDQIREGLRDGTFRNDSSGWTPELEYRVLNMSVGLVMHQEHVKSQVTRMYGEKSAELTTVKAAFSELYDRCQSYRIVFCIRNAMVHSSRQLLTLHSRAWIERGGDSPETTKAELSVFLSRSAFSDSGANGAVRREVGSLAADPEILVMSQTAYAEVRKTHASLFELLHPERDQAVQTLWDYISETSAAGGGGPHFFRIPIADGLTTMDGLRNSQPIVDYVSTAARDEKLVAVIPHVLTTEKERR